MKKKILFLIHTLNGGGAERVLANIVQHIDKEKFDITVTTIVNEGVYIDEIKKVKGVRYRYIFNSYFKKSRKDSNNRYNQSTTKIMNKIWDAYKWLIKNAFNKITYIMSIRRKYDIEVAFLEGMCAKIISASPNKKSKKIAWIHTDITTLTKSSTTFKNEEEERECYKKFDKIVCVSNGVREAFIKKTGISKNVIRQINPINDKEIITKSEEIIEKVKKSERFVICSVGRLIHEKGYDRLLRCQKKLLDSGLNTELWIIGEGEERKKLEQYIEQEKLGDTVKLLGFENNPYKYIKNSDLFVSSSRVEGLSSVLCEAVILGKVIVTTECPGVSEILGNKGSRGAVITENNEEALYEGLYNIISNKELYKEYKEKAKSKNKKFVLEKQIKSIERIFERL